MLPIASALLLLAVLAWPRRSPGQPAWPPDRPHRGRADSTGRLSGPQGSQARRGLLRSRRLPLARHGPRGARAGQVLDVLDALGPALEAGLPAGAAVRCLHECATDPRSVELLGRLARAADAGEPLSAVWGAQARSLRSCELDLVAQAWALSERLGAPLAEAVALSADLLRKRMARQRRVAIALSGPRASMTVLTLLPLAGPGVGLLIGVPPTELYAGAAAKASLAAGLLAMGGGRWWCAALVRGLAVPRSVRQSRP